MQKITPIFREASFWDSWKLERLEKKSFRTDWYDGLMSAKDFRKAARDPRKKLLVAEVGGKIGGYILVCVDQKRPISHIDSIAAYTDTYQKNEGGVVSRSLGFALLQAAERVSLQAGRIGIACEVDEKNVSVLRACKRFGYQEIGIEEDCFTDGSKAHVLQKKLV